MRILVVDDHSLFRDGIVSLLEAAEHRVVGQVGDGNSAVEAVRRLHPDLVLMDISMPQKNGLSALGEIKETCPETKVIMLTVSEADDDLFAAIEAGADGYLHKNIHAPQFLDMLSGVENGEAAISRKTAARLMQGYQRKSEDPPSARVTLTDREIELLQLVAEGASNTSIAQMLSISTNTVKYHLRNIMQKLDAQNRTEAVTNAIRAGIIQAEC